MNNSICFTVYGEPIPKGSTRAFIAGGKINTVNANVRTKAWQNKVAGVALDNTPTEPLRGAVAVDIYFYLPRPKTVKREYPTVPADLDKLQRCIFDALTGILFKDDAQVIRVRASKEYAEQGKERVVISISEVE